MNWPLVKLKDITNYRSEKIESHLVDLENYISTDNMLPNRQGIELSVYPPTSKKVSRYTTNDILVSNIRPYFKKIWFAKKDGGCSNDVIVFENKSKDIVPKFLYYELSQDCFFDFMMAGANGTKMPRGNKKSILNFEFLLPPLKIQQNIANILSAYDELIENNLKRINLLEQASQNIYKEWFVNMRFPGHENSEFDSETGLPFGWIKEDLQELFDFKEGPGLRNWQYRTEGIPFLNIRMMKDGDLDFSNTKYLDESEVNEKYEHFLLNKFDHILSTSGTLGKVVTIRDSHLPLCLNTSIIRFRSKDEKIGKWYIRETIKSESFLNEMKSFATGSAQLNFGPKHLKMMKVLLPEKEVCQKFEELIEPIEVLMLKLKDTNQKLKTARDILLPRLMNQTIEV